MTEPTLSQIHTDQILNNVAIAYLQDMNVFAHDAVMPRVPVSDSSDNYKKFERNDFYRNDVQTRARGTTAPLSGWGNISNETYNTRPMDSLGDLIDPDDAADQDEPVQLMRRTTRRLTHQHMINREAEFINQYMTTGQWSTDLDGDTGDFTKWSDSSSTPVKDIKNEVLRLKRLSGNALNTRIVFVAGPEVILQLEENSAITDRLGNDERQVATTQFMANLFKVDEVIEAGAVENTEEENDGRNMSFMHGKTALLAMVAQEPDINTPSAGYNFVWDEMPGGGSDGFRTKRFTVEEKNNSTQIEIDSYHDFKVTAPDLGVFFDNAVA